MLLCERAAHVRGLTTVDVWIHSVIPLALGRWTSLSFGEWCLGGLFWDPGAYCISWITDGGRFQVVLDSLCTSSRRSQESHRRASFWLMGQEHGQFHLVAVAPPTSPLTSLPMRDQGYKDKAKHKGQEQTHILPNFIPNIVHTKQYTK